MGLRAPQARQDTDTSHLFVLGGRVQGQPISGFVLANPEDFLLPPQVRKTQTEEDEDKDKDFRESIAETRRQGGGIAGTGYIQPVVAYINPDEDGPVYVLEKGFRRVRHGLLLKEWGHVDKIPAYIKPERGDERQNVAEQIIENVQRSQLNLLDLSKALRDMRHEWGWSWEDIRKRIGFSMKTLKRYVDIQDMPEDVQRLIEVRSDTLTVAEEIAKIEDADERAPLIERGASGEGVRTLLPDVKKVQTRSYVMGAGSSSANGNGSGGEDNSPEATPQPKGPTPLQQRQAVEKRFKALNSEVSANRKELSDIRRETGKIITYFGVFTDEQTDALEREIVLMENTLAKMRKDIDREKK